MDIKSANIINAIHSIAEDHVVAVTTDIYDTGLNKYQSEINAQDYNNITTMQQQIAQIINNPQSGVETYYLSDYALSVNALLAAARNKLAKTIVISDVKTATTHQFGGIAELVGGNDTSNYIFTETVHGPFIKNGSDLTINPAKNAKANTYTRVIRAQYSTTTQAYTANVVVIEDWATDSSSIEVGDIDAITTEDTTGYDDTLFVTAAPVRVVETPRVQTTAAIIKHDQTGTSTTIVSNKNAQLTISDNSSQINGSINNVGDSVTMVDGTNVEVVRVDLNDDGTKTTTVNVSVPTTNTDENSITKQYTVSSNSGAASDQLVVSQSGVTASEITPPAQDGPINGYVVYMGYMESMTLADFKNLSTDTIIKTGKSNFYSDTQGSIWEFRNQVSNPEVGGILWYASPADYDYVRTFQVNGSEHLIDSAYDETNSVWVKTGSRFSAIKTFMLQGVNYILYAIDHYDSNRITSGQLVSWRSVTASERSATSQIILEITTKDANDTSDYSRHFFRTNSIWVSGSAQTISVSVNIPNFNFDAISLKSDVTWITGKVISGFGGVGYPEIHVDEMSTGTPRVGHVSLTLDGTEHIITITQRKSVLTVTPTSFSIPTDPGSIPTQNRMLTISTTSDKEDYNSRVIESIVPSADWITIPGSIAYPGRKYVDGTHNEDMTSVINYLSYKPNTTGDQRQGSVVVSGKDGEDPVTVTITQEAFSFDVFDSIYTQSSKGDVIISIPFLKVSDIDSVTVTMDGVTQQATLFAQDLPVNTSLNYYAGLVKQHYKANLLNLSLEDKEATVTVTVHGNSLTKTITRKKVSYYIKTIPGQLIDPNTTKYSVPVNGGTLYYDLYTYNPTAPQLVFAGKKSSVDGIATESITREQEALFDTSIQPTCTITAASGSDYHYDVNLTFPATTTPGVWMLIFGDGQRDSSGNLKYGRALRIKQNGELV